MAQTTLIATTPRRGLEFANPKLFGQYDQLVAFIGERLGPAHALMMAEPVMETDGGVSWYLRGDERVQPAQSLPQAEREALVARAESILSDIRALAAEMTAGGSLSMRELGGMLEDMTHVAGEPNLWAVKGAPVLIGWGLRRIDATRTPGLPGTLVAKGAARASADQPPQGGGTPQAVGAGVAAGVAATNPTSDTALAVPAARSGRSWLGPVLWIAFVLLLLLIGFRLMNACAIGSQWPEFMQRWVGASCPAPAAESPGTAAAIRAAEAANRARELALARKAAACGAVCEPGPPVPPLPDPAPPRPNIAPTIDDLTRRIPPQDRGLVEVTLAWNGAADLDLHIQCPGGGKVDYQSRSSCGGQLNEDLNVSGGGPDATPIEHVRWGAMPPAGTYTVQVNLFSRHNDARAQIPYVAVLRLNGQVITQREGFVQTDKTMQTIFTFVSPIVVGPRAP